MRVKEDKLPNLPERLLTQKTRKLGNFKRQRTEEIIESIINPPDKGAIRNRLMQGDAAMFDLNYDRA